MTAIATGREYVGIDARRGEPRPVAEDLGSRRRWLIQRQIEADSALKRQ